MQTIQFIPCDSGTAGGSKRGSIFASAADLENMFGAPAFEGKGDKITTEHVIDYQVMDDEGDSLYGSFSLYDWRYGRNFNDDYETIEWNIGGKSFDDACAAELALKIFKETNDSLVFAKLHDVPKDEEFFL